MKKSPLTIVIIIALLFSAAAVAFVIQKQIESAREIYSAASSGLGAQMNIPATPFPAIPSGAPLDATSTPADTTESEIAKLREEIEALKKQKPQVVYKTVLTPTTPAPKDLATEEALKQAKEQISSLQRELQQVQLNQKAQQSSSVSDADLIKSWQADSKVVQVACQNTFTGAWQLGSGVLISADGRLLTNQHVVKPTIGILLPDYCLILFNKDFDNQTQIYSKQYRASIKGFFSERDAALLQITDIVSRSAAGAVQLTPAPGPYSYFQIAPQAPSIGDSVFVIGYPESAKLNFSVTKGIISNLTSDNIYFGTDAQIDRGNSGGAALNSAGLLVGIPTWKYVSSGDYRGYILNIGTIDVNTIK